jgi:hypothetical protein
VHVRFARVLVVVDVDERKVVRIGAAVFLSAEVS